LLPHGAENWSLERKRQVLLHELTHVQRGDLLTQSIAAVGCALYWFNPLSWWGAAQMRRLRELACDDAVVMHTTDPTEYAQTLLDVAKDYRCRQQAITLAMARTPNVESRIFAILDATRRRAALSKRSARIVGIAALVLSAVVGTMQLVSRAGENDQEPAEKKSTQRDESQTAAKHDESIEPRKMAVRVMDEQGRPIAGANVHVSLWEMDPDHSQFPGNRDVPTNERGVAEFELPRRLVILRLWAWKDSFVSRFAGFETGTHEDGRLIPDQYEFTLMPGHRLSGSVVDADGKPIAGASVQVKVEVDSPPTGVNPHAVINTWLASGKDAVITGEDGRWEITNAPAPKEPDHEFHLQVTHPQFAGDTNWGGLQKAQEITADQLRAGTARLKLERGVSLSGIVTGPDGQPVTKGLVIWSDRPYWAQGVNEAPIDDAGHYQTRHLAPGKYPITILAPGFAPERRTIELKQPGEQADFQLEPGQPIRIQIEDPSGKSVPKAYVQIGHWRGTEAIYNHKHPNVPDSGIPDHANENGLYTWDWAPADAVEYEIFAKGYDSKSVRLIAKDEPHHVQLAPELTISGKVVDAKSGASVARFRVIPVTAFRPDDYSTDFQSGSVAEGKDGRYKIEIDSHGRAGYRYRVRIEAEGYRTALGRKSLAVGDAPLEEDFRLEPAPALTGTVVQSNGEPAEAFIVAVGTPTARGHFRFGSLDASFGIIFNVQGSNAFKLPATFEPSRIRVFNDSGFAEVLRQPDEQIGTITLQPWASVSGHLMQDGKLVPNEYIYFHPLAEHALTDARFQDSFTAKTDRNGNFRFDRLPPMSGSVRAHLGPWQDSPLTSSKSVPVVLKAGEHREVALGGDGARITGRVVATGRRNDALSKQWSINYLVSRGRGVDYPSDARPLSFRFTGPVQAAWLRHPEFRDWLATRENYYVKLTDDGQLRITGVPPGAYDLIVQLYEQPAGCLVETIGEKIVPVTITKDQAAAEEVALGDIEVACHTGPRVGSDMRAFQFNDADGRARYIDDMKGRHVLFHVWASWCEPCRASMPALKASVEQQAADRLTVVGLNIDKDAAAARAIATQDRLNWAQNYLGDDSDLMRQLGISSVPAYYLIGPDGKLVGSFNRWEEAEMTLKDALR
jgi:thiol-disulfide isomerase/thioredoxin